MNMKNLYGSEFCGHVFATNIVIAKDRINEIVIKAYRIGLSSRNLSKSVIAGIINSHFNLSNGIFIQYPTEKSATINKRRDFVEILGITSPFL